MPDCKYLLDGRNPLSYMGVKPQTPPKMIIKKRAPTDQDYKDMPLGTQWVHIVDTDLDQTRQYVLASTSKNKAKWLPLNEPADEILLPNHSVALGEGVPGINSTGPVATIGATLISTGINTDPTFGITNVIGGGTGRGVIDQYGVLVGGETDIDHLRTVHGLGNNLDVLTSQGPATRPVWDPTGGLGVGGPVAIKTFLVDGSYTVTPGTGSFIVECIGGGGGGGSITASTGGAGGGGAGGYCRKLFLTSVVNTPQAITIGQGGIAGVNGTNTTFGAGMTLLTANGGNSGGNNSNGLGGLGGTSTGGDINITGGNGGSGFSPVDASSLNVGMSGFGAGSIYSGQSLGLSYAGSDFTDGTDGNLYGGGAAGGAHLTVGNSVGGTGANGIVIITEFSPFQPPMLQAVPTGFQINTIILDTPGAGIYTPSANLTQCVIECIAGGAGGTDFSPGAGGAYCKQIFTSTDIGISQNYVVGAAGNPQTSMAPTPGGDTTFGTGSTLMTSTGGGISSFPFGQVAPVGGVASGGYLNLNGETVSTFQAISTGQGQAIQVLIGSKGGNSGTSYGFGGVGGVTGFDGTNVSPLIVTSTYGSLYGGGGGSFPLTYTPSPAFSSGAQGAIIITEYISA